MPNLSVRLLLTYLLLLFSPFGWTVSKATLDHPASAIHGSTLPVPISTEERMWLQQYHPLRVAVVPNAFPPFDLMDMDKRYQGISADYLDLIGHTLQLTPQITVYTSYSQAYQALRAKQVDMVMTAVGNKPPADVVFSTPYFPNHIVEVTADGLPLAHDGPVTLAIAEASGLQRDIKKHYPQARIKEYATVYQALAATANRQVDGFIGNAAGGTYFIEHYHLNSLAIGNYAELTQNGFHIAVRKQDQRLATLLNRVIATIPAQVQQNIVKRWVTNASAFDISDRINLSADEKVWVSQHPQVFYNAAIDRMPFVFSDNRDQPAGLSVELLDLIGKKAGIKFTPVWTNVAFNQLDPSIANNISVLPVLVRNVEKDLPISRTINVTVPYITSHWVIVGRKNEQSVQQASDLAGKRIAVTQRNQLVDRLHKMLPGTTLDHVSTYMDAYAEVANGHADATIANVFTASYIIQHHFSSELKILAPLAETPVEIGFGVLGNNPQLLSIMNKALDSIQPDEMLAIQSRWTQISHPNTQWMQMKSWLLRGGSLIGLGVVLFWIWFILFLRQVRGRSHAELALRNQLNLQKVLLDGIPHPLYLRDPQARMVTCNTAYEEALGVKRSQLVGKTVTDLEPYIRAADDAAPMDEHYQALLSSGKPINLDKWLLLNGHEVKVYNWAVRLEAENGDILGLVGGWIDITEREELLHALDAARTKAEQASEAKSIFLATISHEIRTPMNALIGLLQLMARQPQPSQQQKLYLDNAQNSAVSLLTLIDDILDLSKIEAGKLTFNWQPADIRRLIDEVLNIFQPVARQKNLSLSAEISPSIESGYSLDPLRFKQLLTNLVGNALKFTFSGGVKITLRRLEKLAQQETLLLRVEDSGLGIEAAELPLLFEPFSQASSTLKRVAGGTGLGLPICRQLAQMMQGDITLASEPGLGTQVDVRLTLDTTPCPAQPEPLVEQLHTPFHSCTIAVVDDHPTNRLVLREQLQLLGCNVVESEDGQQALLQCEQQAFDVIFCDCSMPVLDGYTFTRRLRSGAHGVLNQATPVLGYTANAQQENQLLAMESGMNDCLIKPVDLSILTTVLHHHLSPETHCLVTKSERDASLFSQEKVRQLSFSDPTSERRLLASLLAANQHDLPALIAASEAGQWQDVSTLAHRIKGAAKMIDAKAITALCEQLETAVGLDEQEKRHLCDSLKQQAESLQQALSNRISDPEHPPI
ncbi:transporter substrate-binding domain-containing protein [Enterobacter mori]|uniref:transporter substrate-binding domain-containing protein n=1 Tax=Enterobacter mori TaxID=539813 RepID=UPI001B8C2FF7|nr:transporter substrate-binding domain-containing protein [Enterobacter mori]MBS3046383.1 transporter substrate-binding domain-containing protein [Enterobacter mori]